MVFDGHCVATAICMAGLSAPDSIGGVRLLPLLDDPALDVRRSLSIMNFWKPESTHSLGVVTRKRKYFYWYSQKKNMLATEDLFDMEGVSFESTNAAFDGKNLDALNEVRQLCESHSYEINAKAINSHYRKFKDVFDRQQPWKANKKVPSRK